MGLTQRHPLHPRADKLLSSATGLSSPLPSGAVFPPLSGVGGCVGKRESYRGSFSDTGFQSSLYRGWGSSGCLVLLPRGPGNFFFIFNFDSFTEVRRSRNSKGNFPGARWLWARRVRPSTSAVYTCWLFPPSLPISFSLTLFAF